jgi:hypothetical protein
MTSAERLARLVVDRSWDDAGARTTPGAGCSPTASDRQGSAVRKLWLTLQELLGEERTHR